MQIFSFVSAIRFFYYDQKSVDEIALATDWRKILGMLNSINDVAISNVEAIKTSDVSF